MAACAIRKLATSSIFCYAARRVTSFNHLKRVRRHIHSSPALLEKYYSEKHEYVEVPEGSEEGTVGITDYAQDKLGDVVFIQLPEIGQVLEAEGEAGVLESVKAASDLYSPVSGTVTSANDKVVDNPKLVNESPYEEGWLFKLKLSEPKELERLMNQEAYVEYLKSIE